MISPKTKELIRGILSPFCTQNILCAKEVEELLNESQHTIPKLIPVPDAAKLIGDHINTFRRRLIQENISVIKFNARKIMLREQDLLALIQRKQHSSVRTSNK